LTTETRPLVLTIDDEPEITGLIEMALEVSGYAVVTANSVFEGMKVLADTEPNLILLDIMMPGVDGWQFCETLRTNTTTANIPVVFVTALDTSAFRAEAERAGAAGFISKPFSSRSIEAEVARVLAGR
jgi:DNA-binding response OmpR family regulator